MTKSRMTRQRRIVLEELAKVKTHPTADELYEMVRKRLPRVSLSTVYRNLELLAQTGHVLRLDMAGPQRHYDADTREHYHVCCATCGRVDDLPMDLIEGIKEAATGKAGYDIMGYRLKFIGVCPTCRQAGKSSEAVG